MLLTNPNVSLVDGIDAGDGSFFHEDVVVERIIHSSVPQAIYADNVEFIDGFSQTLVNYSPISININDYWNKTPLRNVVIPLDDKVYDYIDESKIIKQAGKKAFFVNSMLGLQDKLAFTYMNNFYTTATKAKTNHFLHQKMTYLFKKHQIPEENRQMMFKDINDLFKAERFVTNKEFNTKKGKVIALEYAAKASWDSQMEGALTSSAFFVDHITNDVFDYSVESTILPDIWNAFVKPVAHPLGMVGDYTKICKIALTDRVLSKLKWRADGVSVKCTHPSSVPGSSFIPPRLLLSWEINKDWTTFLDNPLKPSDYDPYDIDTWVGPAPYDAAPTMELYVSVKNIGEVQNTEEIIRDESLTGPWDPLNNTPEMFFATADGFGLWKDIKEIDEGQGNILEDVQSGYGEYEYSGYSFTKYIFENRNHLIEYSCYLADGTVQRIIEYYRYDLLDSSVTYNTIASGTWLPRNAYPDKPHANIVHGRIDLEDCEYRDPTDEGYDPTLPDCGPLKTQKPFVLDDESDPADLINGVTGIKTPNEDTKGLDYGHFTDKNGTFIPVNIEGVVTLSSSVRVNDTIQIVSSTIDLETIRYVAIAPDKSIPVPFNTSSAMVFINGVLQPKMNYTVTPLTIELSGLAGGDRIEIVETNSTIIETVLNYNDVANLDEFTIQLDIKTNNISVYRYTPNTPNTEIGYKIYPDNITTDFYRKTAKISEPPINGDIIIVVYHEVDSSEIYKTIKDYDPLPMRDFYNGSNKKSVEVFINGLKIQETYYSFVTGYDQWSASGNYTWDVDENVYHVDPIITDIYTLIARYVQTRDCMVNVYNLREEEDPSIEEDFSIRCIPLLDSIVDSALLPVDGYDPDTSHPDDRNTGEFSNEIDNLVHHKFVDDPDNKNPEVKKKVDTNTANTYHPANRYK